MKARGGRKSTKPAADKPLPAIVRDVNFLRYVVSFERNNLRRVEKMLNRVADDSEPSACRALTMATAISTLSKARLVIWNALNGPMAALLADVSTLLVQDEVIGAHSNVALLDSIIDENLARLRKEDLPDYQRIAEEGAKMLDTMQYGAPKGRAEHREPKEGASA